MLFFQSLLLAGYAYALIVSQRLRLRSQALLHISLLLLAGIFLPFSISGKTLGSLPTQTNPTFWLLGVLLLTVGPPFFVLSATAPLLQRWFSHSSHKSASDPYFLYAVSNAGSMLALLAFPFLLEPSLTLRRQTMAWAVGYLLLATLIAFCALLLGKAIKSADRPIQQSKAESPGIKTRLHWIILAFIPSSLMLGVTTYISTDVAAMPLIWIIPLTIYLLTFILAFANKQVLSLRMATLMLPPVVVLLAALMISRPKVSVWVHIVVHLLLFFIAAFVAHRRLAIARPGIFRLPEYFLCIAFGGVLGGIFNALIAPNIFSTAIEYPAVVVLACLMLAASDGMSRFKPWMRVAFPSVVLVLTASMAVFATRFQFSEKVQDGLVLILPLVIAYLVASRQRVVFALSLLAVWAGSFSYVSADRNILRRERNFFGIWEVSRGPDGTHRLRHGSTFHGVQYAEAERKCIPAAYYSRGGPVGQIFEAFTRTEKIAALGLGTGAVVTYSTEGQQWDFYEIDPAVVQLASKYFTYLADCAKGSNRTVIGDARLRLHEAPHQHYDLIVLDAFSSDSVPAHLLTTQALDLYLSKLDRNGLLIFHISNRYLNLEKLMSGLANRSGLTARINNDGSYDAEAYIYPSTWVVMARDDSVLGKLAGDDRWRRLKGDVVWTDDFSNVFWLLR